MVTARSSRSNFARFTKHWDGCVVSDFTKLYGISRLQSHVSAARFENFCRRIDAPCARAHPSLEALFNPALVGAVYRVREPAFDYLRLAEQIKASLLKAQVNIMVNSTAFDLRATDGDRRKTIMVRHKCQDTVSTVSTNLLFNCTYSSINHLGGGFGRVSTQLRHEIAQMALVEVPRALGPYGITVMDGPFFSTMPYPESGCHTLSHVRYTPELRWNCAPGLSPQDMLAEVPPGHIVNKMIRDAARYLPAMRFARPVGTVREVKTILKASLKDDSRPILFEKHIRIPGTYAILGGKIDNVFDIFDRLEEENLVVD